ncbi:hypothetical protein DL96DRAFT_1531667 [Flagelloscypha sp. PMI_526]|nr:hypothetical protein DL96DRAFT_1531667 [Flagelloscypha sp. PMI_526]
MGPTQNALVYATRRLPSFFHQCAITMALSRRSRVIKLSRMPYPGGDAYNPSADEVDGPMKDVIYSQSWLGTYPNDENQGQKDLELKTRRICQDWPRDPQGKILYPWPDGAQGKQTPEVTLQSWGATLADFYTFSRFPNGPGKGLVSFTSGSKLSSCMKLIGGEKTSAGLVEWQSFEPDPRRIEPRNVLHNVSDSDHIKYEMARRPVIYTLEEAGDMEQFAMNLPKPFHWDKYSIRPRTPFEDQRPYIQQRIPLHLLPKKLHIHDPDSILESKNSHSKNSTGNKDRWPLNSDGISATYNLKLSCEGQKKAADELAEAEQTRKPLEGLFCPPENALTRLPPMGFIAPPTFYVYSQKPFAPESIPEAHLYLDAKHKIGTGNHSRVYSAELELPLQCLAEPEMCRACAEHEIKSSHSRKSGRVPSTGYVTSELYLVEWTSSNPLPLPCSLLEPISSSSKCPISLGIMSFRGFIEEYRALKLLDKRGLDPRTRTVENESKRDYHKRVVAADLQTAIRPEKVLRYYYTGPLRIIELETPWHVPGISEPCQHISYQSCPTTTVRLAAKLSSIHDGHMATEARNYEMFPSYFFEHWSGYHLVPPIQDPVPLGALVPQYYGHYVKPTLDADGDLSMDSDFPPLMLVEHCGTQAEPWNLNADDRQECLSMILRFHIAGWVHNSPYPRNFLVQDGPIDATLKERRVKGVKRKIFRLIDFGRSIGPQAFGNMDYRKNRYSTTDEETQVKKHFMLEDV